MTMKREAKTQAMRTVSAIYDGSKVITSETPAELKAHGKNLPAKEASRITLRAARFSASKAQSRERHVAQWPERQMARGNGHERVVTRKP
jgi:hypothetical protein